HLSSLNLLTSRTFPYTALFRSPKGLRLPICMDYAGCTHKLKASILMENPSSSQRKAPPLETERGFLAAAASFAMWRLGIVGADRDRESTRLNSSHEWISYAVFC